jgi:tRNA A37 methylthiotransferase MiaB
LKKPQNDQKIIGAEELLKIQWLFFIKKNYQIGDFVDVKITSCTSATLIGDAVQLSNHI